MAGEIVGTKIGLCLKHHVPREPAVGGPHHERRPEQFPGHAISRLVEKRLGERLAVHLIFTASMMNAVD